MLKSKSSFIALLSILFDKSSCFRYTPGNIILLDHLNINHEKSRHDLVRAFYFDTLGFSSDPRKQENLDKGRKTLWANAGITQLHLPEEEHAQVFDGSITIAYPDEAALDKVTASLSNPSDVLRNSRFSWRRKTSDNVIRVNDPWGSQFRLVVDAGANDIRGVQPGLASIPCAISDLCVHIPRGKSLQGIARFYDTVLGAPSLPITENGDAISVIVSPQQTLTFKYAPPVDRRPTGLLPLPMPHEILDLDEQGKVVDNRGPHISMYVEDLSATYQRADQLGVLFVNTRFKRRAYTLQEAVDQCMFRCLDIIDPETPSAGPIIRLEHEIRSVTNADGSLYKSCPFNEIPPQRRMNEQMAKKK